MSNKKANRLLRMIKENNLTTPVQEVENTELDMILDIIEKYDLGYDCLKSSYTEDVEEVSEMLEVFEDEEIDEDFIPLMVQVDEENEISETGGTRLVKPKPYHNMFSKTMGNSYKTIMAGRRKGGTADVSTLKLGTDKFYDKDIKHYRAVFDDAMSSGQPRKRYRQLVRALVNLVVNFKKRKPELSRRAERILSSVREFPKTDKYNKSTK